MIDFLNISYTQESSVLTEGEMSFTVYENMNMANTVICTSTVISRCTGFDIVALCLA